ncbi:stage III sporulation protein AA [Anaerotignum sp. MB30-C6]|uniref:stage III sporulation protein AA n=1 Tax=Anaerotignum sp. MB30-C6 TaxID=3070814 RepID=UPI0027DB57DE|nr:stage III sporulation protein AA [Anaerotignum sp. MB30-C6]WMI80167.1 stage III sporulation protein AA [Anaerotignum sp. MB30-C6]
MEKKVGATLQKLEEIWKLLPVDVGKRLKEENFLKEEQIQEIRLRALKPLFVKTNKNKYFIADGYENWIVTNRQIKEAVERLGGYSLYAFEEELKQGYLTVSGGHRVGFCGRAVLEHGKVKTLRQVSSLNIRIAGEIIGCGEQWLPYLFENNSLCHTLIVSPPGCGKTTLLRDIIRCLSYGLHCKESYNVGVVDERGEIAAMKDGVPQMDVGPCTDVQENCPKAEGMRFLLRSMTPDVIAVDELGKEADFYGVEELLHAGVTLISTVHGNDMNGLLKNIKMKKMIGEMEKGRILFLSKKCGTGTVEEIWDAKGIKQYERGVKP